MTASKFAVFDIDGTLIRWQLYHAVADKLARRGHIGVIEYQALQQARMTWKKREQANSFDRYELTLVNLVSQAMVGLSVDEFMAACRSVLAEYKDQVYRYTRGLLRELKDDGYLLFAISGSQREIVQMLADYYGFDDYGGSESEVKDGRYTGAQQSLRRDRKPVYLQELVKKHGATYKDSVGVGDSESDIPLLKTVERPIAFNPSKLLYEHARQHSWPIIIERKNVIYELEPKDGRYELH